MLHMFGDGERVAAQDDRDDRPAGILNRCVRCVSAASPGALSVSSSADRE
jgi:hypothetical protein